jgi:predicted S18 family serine protease
MATIVQTVVITLTLLVFIFQFRSQERAIREASYQNLLGRYNDFIMSGQESDSLFARFLASNADIKEGDLAAVRRLMISYGIIEEAYELYKKGWIDEEAWEQWNSWLKALSRHPHFPTLHARTAGMFDKDFQDHVTRLLDAGGSPPLR